MEQCSAIVQKQKNNFLREDCANCKDILNSYQGTNRDGEVVRNSEMVIRLEQTAAMEKWRSLSDRLPLVDEQSIAKRGGLPALCAQGWL